MIIWISKCYLNVFDAIFDVLIEQPLHQLSDVISIRSSRHFVNDLFRYFVERKVRSLQDV